MQMLDWANQFNICCFLDNHKYPTNFNSYECLLAVGAKKIYSAGTGNAFIGLKHFYDEQDDWLFGHFSYDLKNEIEDLISANTDNLGFADIFFFVPEIIIWFNKKEISISAPGNDPEKIINEILSRPALFKERAGEVNIRSRFTRSEYLETIQKLKQHILAGDCYEINFCQEFFAEDQIIDPLQSYLSLSTISPNPFGGFYKIGKKYVLCASPERYLKKEKALLISQPMKGTWKRNLENDLLDLLNKQKLGVSSKERSENVMVVDLVRNDLSKVCEEGTVRVDELYGVYSFPQVHQMISTITGKVKKQLHWTDLITATFPMGSMTGAPKKRVMELIEKYEKTKRGVFSGSIGYVTPAGDFDFNVVIRSILYNQENKYLSYQVGSGITFYSDPESEYEECLLKAEAIKKVLAKQHLF